MASVKNIDYTNTDLVIAKYTKALAHPARVAIMQLLLSRATCVCGDIVDELPISQSTVSQHLKELKEAGLIKGDIEGTSVCYCVNESEWQKAKLILSEFLNKKIIKKEKCC